MKAPDKIYIQEGAVVRTEKTFDNDVKYIREDALLAWAKEKNQEINTDEGEFSLGYVSAMIDLIDKVEWL